MSDLTVILDRKDLVVTMESKTIRVDQPGHRPRRIPLNMIARVIVVGNPMVSCGVWRALSDMQIPAVLLPSRGAGPAVYMGSGLSGSVEKRMAQYRAVNDGNCSLAISRWLISMKLDGQDRVLKNLQNGKSEPGVICEPVGKYQAELQMADTRNSLMGHEGAAAAAYFKTLGRLISGKWKFSGRNRRPPRDPVNSCLSLGYVLAGSEVSRVVQQGGLDPAVGFLHSLQAGRESLVLDILEPIRPKVDEFVLGLLDNPLGLRNFTISEQDGCLLDKDGRKAFYAAWSAWQDSGDEGNDLKSVAKELVNELVRFF